MSERSRRETTLRGSRRDFLKTSSTAAVTGAFAAQWALNAGVYAAGSDVLRVGLIGCGGRGSGAAAQALTADPHTRLVAMADAFADRLDSSLESLKVSPVGDRVLVDDDHKFHGFDGYKQVIDAVDVVVHATPPHFRPAHVRAAVEAGKHVFVEKPIAVDAPGVRSMLETSKLAEEKGLSFVSGLCWRYHNGMRATFERIHAGDIGQIAAMQCSYNSNGVWEPRCTREECDSDMECQMRNWYYYTWLSGDFNVEQHIHSLDKMAWAMQDETPVRASGSGGRQQRTEPKYGNIYDHFDVVYEYASGVKAFARCRHFQGCEQDVTDHIYGTKGRVDVFKHRIHDLDGKTVWRFKDKENNMYQAEHDEMFAAIRSGQPINNGHYMCMSTMLAIMGRMVCYTGKSITWDEALNSQEDLTPEYAWGPLAVPDVAVPGITPLRKRQIANRDHHELQGPTAMPSQLVVIAGPDTGLTVDLVPGATLTLGRGSTCDIQLNDPHALRTHCTITVTPDRIVLADNQSTYGTQVAGVKVSQRELKPDDVISVGETKLRLVASTSEATKTLPPSPKDRAPAAQSGATPTGGPRVDGRLRDLVGQTLARYEIQASVADGRSGKVFRAYEPEKDRTVALKVLWPELSRDEEEVQRFVRAIKTMLPIQHANLVRLYRAGKNGPHCWMAMEFVEGESVARVIERIGVGGMLDWEPAFRVALHVARALEVAHEHKIVHRNITPQNILIQTSDNVAKLGDLMLAKALEGTQAATITKPGELIGELVYMAPEQTTGDNRSDCRSDIYSLGATVYRLVAGRPPVEGRNPAETILKIQKQEPSKPTKYQLSIPPLFEGVILKMIAKSPDERFQNPTQLLKDLDRVAKYQGLSGV